MKIVKLKDSYVIMNQDDEVLYKSESFKNVQQMYLSLKTSRPSHLDEKHINEQDNIEEVIE
jgi:hypothetical protein